MRQPFRGGCVRPLPQAQPLAMLANKGVQLTATRSFTSLVALALVSFACARGAVRPERRSPVAIGSYVGPNGHVDLPPV